MQGRHSVFGIFVHGVECDSFIFGHYGYKYRINGCRDYVGGDKRVESASSIWSRNGGHLRAVFIRSSSRGFAVLKRTARFECRRLHQSR